MPATAVDHEHSVTPRELFFDLVFVFAFTQVTTLLANDPTFAGIGRGVLVLAALWWPWTAYAWLTNTVDPEEGFVGAALLVVLIAMFLAALAVPGVFDDDGVLFGACFVLIVALHLALYALAGREDPDLLAAVLRLAPWTLLGATLILIAGFGFADGARIWLWVAALLTTYVGAGLSGSSGWRVFPTHLAERYGLVIIIAIGEAFVAIGIGATTIGPGEVAAAVLGLLVVALHLGLYALAGRGDRDLLAAVLRLAPWTLIGATLILIAGFGFADGARIWLWVAALLTTYVGAGLSGSSGWRVFPTHLTERYGLVIIIAIGEAFVAIGIGATTIGPGEVAAAVLGLLVATSFWLAYFDFFSIRAARMLAEREGPERAALSRDLYAYTHLPMIVGIVLFAFSMKVIVGHVGDELDSAPAFALCGGSALYLLAYSAIRSRIERRLSLSRGRFAAAVLLLLVFPLATAVPAVVALALVTVIWLGLHTYEIVWWREARTESRSMLASS